MAEVALEHVTKHHTPGIATRDDPRRMALGSTRAVLIDAARSLCQ